MHSFILGDSQSIFRAGTAKVLAMEEDFRIIAQCADLENLERAMLAHTGLDCPGGNSPQTRLRMGVCHR